MAPRYLNVDDLVPRQPPPPRQAPPAQSGPERSAGRRRRRGEEGSYSITATPEAHSQDMGRRMVVYSIQMLLRVVCLVVLVAVDSWAVRAVCLAGVVVLPWSAVLLANVGADRSERSSSYAGPDLRTAPQLTGRADHPGDPADGASGPRVRDNGSRTASDDQRGSEDPLVIDGEVSA